MRRMPSSTSPPLAVCSPCIHSIHLLHNLNLIIFDFSSNILIILEEMHAPPRQ